MQIEQLLQNMSPDIYLKLRQCVETGKWMDGTALSEEQLAVCMQGVMLYQAKIERSQQHMTVGEDGEIVHKSKSELKRDFRQQQPIARFKQDDF